MPFDRNMLNKLLLLNDKQLEQVIKKLATDYGLDLSRLQLTPENLKNLRRTMESATDEELKHLGEQLKNGRLGHE